MEILWEHYAGLHSTAHGNYYIQNSCFADDVSTSEGSYVFVQICFWWLEKGLHRLKPKWWLQIAQANPFLTLLLTMASTWVMSLLIFALPTYSCNESELHQPFVANTISVPQLLPFHFPSTPCFHTSHLQSVLFAIVAFWMAPCSYDIIPYISQTLLSEHFLHIHLPTTLHNIAHT